MASLPDPKRLKTTGLPQSDLLSRLRSFLPRLDHANAELENREQEDCLDADFVPVGDENAVGTVSLAS